MRRVTAIDRALEEHQDVVPTIQAYYLSLISLILAAFFALVAVLIAAAIVPATAAIFAIAAVTLISLSWVVLDPRINPYRMRAVALEQWQRERLEESSRYREELSAYRARCRQLARGEPVRESPP